QHLSERPRWRGTGLRKLPEPNEALRDLAIRLDTTATTFPFRKLARGRGWYCFCPAPCLYRCAHGPCRRPGLFSGVEKIMTSERIPMTREGYEKLKADLDRMQHKEMIEVTKRIAAAREMGDLSENAEYHAAREDQGMLQARVDALKDKLSRAYFVERNNLPTDA